MSNWLITYTYILFSPFTTASLTTFASVPTSHIGAVVDKFVTRFSLPPSASTTASTTLLFLNQLECTKLQIMSTVPFQEHRQSKKKTATFRKK